MPNPNDPNSYLLPLLQSQGQPNENLLFDSGERIATTPATFDRRDRLQDVGMQAARRAELLRRRDQLLARQNSRGRPELVAEGPVEVVNDPTEDLAQRRAAILAEIEQRNKVLQELEARMGAVSKSKGTKRK